MPIGDLRDYYISSPYLHDGTNYTSVVPIIEDKQKHRFVYRGLVGGADNAIGIIESNVSLSEIVSSPNGNIKLQEMLSKENATKMRDNYYTKIGENLSPLKGHSSYFGKPDFILGTIEKEQSGKYLLHNTEIPDIENMLSSERMDLQQEELLRDKDAIQVNLGGGLISSIQDCWLEQKKDIQYAGINSEALPYTYMASNPIKTSDNKYVYIGEVKMGQTHTMKHNANEPLQFVSPLHYKNVVLWTENKKLVQYFLEEKHKGLNFALGTLFSNRNMKNAMESNSSLFIGGLALDEEGKCTNLKNIPESVKKVVKEYFLQSEDKAKNNIIQFDNSQR